MRMGKSLICSRRVFPLNVPVVVYGSKYDVFGSLELEKMKWLCRGLRYFAHSNGCDLVFGSNKEKGFNDAKSIIYRHLYTTTRVPKTQLNHS